MQDVKTQNNSEKKNQKDRRLGKGVRRSLLAILAILLATGGLFGWALWSSRFPESVNMGTAGGMDMGSNMPMTPAASTPIASLQAPQTAEHVKQFTLTTKAVRLNVGAGKTVDAWTYNGISPGPTLHVQQGDLVEVKLVNTLPEAVTIHWHGVVVPNSADGVAGVTQNAVKHGETYTYRFIAKDPGTYWYHSHEQSDAQVARGLFGMLIIDPKQSSVHDDVDAGITLHAWSNAGTTFNATEETLHVAAKPGDWVRLRLLNTSNDPLAVTLIGAPFRVAALDGNDLNGPQPLNEALLSIASGQRYDIRFHMPNQGAVRLIGVDANGKVIAGPSAIVGEGHAPSTLTTSHPAVFDFTQYGEPRADPIALNAHFDNVQTMTLGFHAGFINGAVGVFTINGKAFPDIPSMVKTGQLVKIRIVNETDNVHPIHLHGHTFKVLTHNGQPLTGSPIYLDTIKVDGGETYEIAFYANNPGLWMLHCHNLSHASRGMDMMLVYPNISTPFSVGTASGNIPE
jgi:FtsP/CotA-like multicopper oxidase with cupredoxin domain